MTAIPSSVALLGMARKDSASPRTEQINFRLKAATIERMESFKLRHPLRPTLTQIVEAAVSEWLDREEADLPPKAKRG